MMNRFEEAHKQLTQIVPNVQIPTKQPLRLEAAQQRILHALDQTIFAAQQRRQRSGITITTRPIVPLDNGIHAIAQLMLNVGRSDFGPMQTRTASPRRRTAGLHQFLAVDRSRYELTDEQTLGGAIVDAAAQPSAARKSGCKNIK